MRGISTGSTNVLLKEAAKDYSSAWLGKERMQESAMTVLMDSRPLEVQRAPERYAREDFPESGIRKT